MGASGFTGQLSPLIFIVASLITCSSGQETPSLETVTQWAVNMDKKLLDLNIIFAIVNDIYQRKVLEKQPSASGLSFQYEELKEMDLVKEMAESLSLLLGKHVRALEKSVEAAEKIAAEYKWNNNLMKDDVKYMNNKELKEKKINLTYSDQFEKEVNFDFSSVHIPVEIYDGNKPALIMFVRESALQSTGDIMFLKPNVKQSLIAGLINAAVYGGLDIDILNGLNWTADLDEQFKKNQEEDPEMLWQYFGSQTGFLRTYPAAMWPSKGVDLYDVRRRSWYTQGSSSPKDMMIMIDTSGSTHGQSLQLMQNAVKSILDTLGENDYVNIVSFAEQASFVSKCFNQTAFVQANYRNKQRLMKDLDLLNATGQADFSEAIRFAFEKFNEFNDNGTNTHNIGANCNKVIMLLTDGGTDTAEEVFEKYNWPNKTVRVFTYAVGATPNPVKALRWMACANRGYFSQIPAMGAIRARVQDYINVLRRPLVWTLSHMIQWIPFRRDTFYDQGLEYTGQLKEKEIAHAKDMAWEITFDRREYIPVLSRPQVIMDEKVSEWGNIYEDQLELGMMTTVTRPVYNYSRESSNQTILGVMAIDVTTTQLEAKTPHSKIGPNGYSFAINPNGYVVFHPNLYTSGEFMTEPPNIDLLELEADQDNKELQDMRSDMIDGINGTKMITTYFLSPDQRYITNDQADYAYVSITNTSFRLGLCVPTYQKKYPKFSGDISKFVWSSANSSVFKVMISPWNYHKSFARVKPNTINLDYIVKLLKTDPDPKNWDLDLLYHLYWDVNHIELQLVQFLSNFSSDKNTSLCDNETYCDIFEDDQSLRTFFIMTNGGMTLVSPASEIGYFERERDLKTSSIFKRALRTTKCIFMADHTIEKRSNNSATPYIITACGSYIKERNDQKQPIVVDKPAVAGERLRHEDVIAVVLNATKTKQKIKTCEDGSLICYLIDDGGFLVATTGSDYREQMGRFFGLVDPPVFSYVQEHFFQITVQYDFQATCYKEDNIKSAGFKMFYVPTMNMLFELLNVGWWTSKAYWLFNSFNLYSLFNSESTVVLADEDESTAKKCVKGTYQYYIKSPLSQATGNITCLNCTRNITAIKLNNTNLLFVVADKMCEECDDLYLPVNQAPAEMNKTEEEEIVCEMAKNLRKRVRDYECHHSDPREDSSECGCASIKLSSLSAILVVILVTFQWMSALR